MRKVLATAGIALGVLLGAAAEVPASAASGDVTVRSETGWQTAPLELAGGQSFTVDYLSGTWSVGSPGLALVGIDGYDAAADRAIYQGCKILTDQTYGHLLARVGESGPFLVAHSGTFTAPASGQLQFRINDDDRCLGDNAGAVNLRVGTAGGETPTSGPAAPTSGAAGPAAPTSGLTLYTADWSPGLNGWAADSSWKTLPGELLSDGTAWDSTIFAPYDTRTVADYAVEARIQVVKADMFGIVLRHSAGSDGYIGIVDGDGNTWISAGNTSYSNDGKLADGYRVDVGAGWHTYRMEADRNVVRFLVDGAQVATATDNRYLTGGLGGINSRRSQLEVSGFSVSRLS
jgi:hypothetical protein